MLGMVVLVSWHGGGGGDDGVVVGWCVGMVVLVMALIT